MDYNLAFSCIFKQYFVGPEQVGQGSVGRLPKIVETVLVPGLSLARHTTMQVSRLPGIHAGGEPRSS